MVSKYLLKETASYVRRALGRNQQWICQLRVPPTVVCYVEQLDR